MNTTPARRARRAVATAIVAAAASAAFVATPGAWADPAPAPAVAGPAPAAAGEGACPADRFCLFENTNLLGGRAVFAGDNRGLALRWSGGSGGVVNNHASSMINNTGRTVELVDSASCAKSSTYVALPRSSDRDLGHNSNNPANFNDKASCVIFR